MSTSIPPRPFPPRPLLLALLLACSLLLSARHSWPSFFNANESIRYFFTVALVEHHSLSIDRVMAYYRSRNVDRAERNGHIYLDKAPGTSLLAVPAYLGWTRLLHPDAPRPPDFPVDRLLWAMTLFACTIPALAAAWALARIGWRFGLSPAQAAALALAALVATPFGLYSTVFFAYAPAAAALAGAFAAIALPERSLPRRNAALAGLLAAAAVVLEYAAAPLAALLCLYATLRGRGRALLAFALAALPLALLLGAYHTACFGSPFATGYSFKAVPQQVELHTQGMLGLSLPGWVALRDSLLSRRQGLFFLVPWLALAVPGVVGLVRRQRAMGMVVGTACLVSLVQMASYNAWDHGNGFGPRFLMHAIPFFGLAAAFAPLAFAAPAARRAVHIVGCGLAAASVVQIWLAFITFPYYFADLADPVYTVSLPLLLRGHLAPSPLADLGVPWQIVAVLPPAAVLAGGAALAVRRRFLDLAGSLGVAVLWLGVAMTTAEPGVRNALAAQRLILSLTQP